jgi:hypothetical protein
MLRNLFAPAARRSKPRSRRSLSFESLEERQLFAGITYDPGTGTVDVTGSNGDDSAFIETLSPNAIRVRLVTPGGTLQQDYNAPDVNLVRFYGLDGTLRANNAPDMETLCVEIKRAEEVMAAENHEWLISLSFRELELPA